MEGVPITLTAWLAALTPERLERIVGLRPDVLAGAPVRDLHDLAERLTHPASVATIVRDLATPHLEVLDAVAALGAGATPERVDELLAPHPAGPEAHGTATGAGLEALEDCALAWPDGHGAVCLNPGVHEVIAQPLALAPSGARLVAQVSAPELQKVTRRWGLDVPKRKTDLVAAVLQVLGDPEAVRRIAGEAPPGVAKVLLGQVDDAVARAVHEGAPAGMPAHLRDPALFGHHRIASAWALENGLAFGPRFDPIDAQLPAEVVLALAGPQHRAPFTPDEPVLPTAPVAPEQVHTTASAAITELLGVVMATLELMHRTPIAVRKSWGVGARELMRVAKVLGCNVADVRLGLELAGRLGLLSPAETGTVGTSEAFTGWRSLPPAQRAADLCTAWGDLRFVPTQDRDADGTSIAALTRFDDGDASVAARALLLGVLDTLDADVGHTSVEALDAGVRWRAPLVIGTGPSDVVQRSHAEAERLGLVALGRLTGAGHRLVESGIHHEVADAFATMLPDVQSRAVVGSDLTIMVLGSPAAHVVDVLDAVAERETRGQASAWRLTPGSVRGALDAGYTSDGVLEALAGLTDTALPQAVEYLVRDVGRRHGHVHVQPAGAVVVGQDEALLAEIAAERSLRRLGLYAVAPTVLVASAPVSDVLGGLRSAGYLPVEAAADGAPVVEVRRFVAAEPSRGLSDDADEVLARWAEGTGVSDDDVLSDGWASLLPPTAVEAPADVVSRLVRGEAPPDTDGVAELASRLARHAPHLRGGELEQLAHAVVRGHAARLRYRSQAGRITVRVVSQIDVEDGYLFAWCHLRGEMRSFRLANVLGVIAGPV